MRRGEVRATGLRALEQLGWSLVSFLGVAVGAAILPTSAFGALALCGSIVALAQALGRSVFSKPLAVAAIELRKSLASIRADCYRQALYPIAAVVLITAAGAAIVPPPYRALVLATGLTVVFALLADINRTFRLTTGQLKSAVGALIAAGVIQLIVTAGAYALLPGDPAPFLFGWASALAVLALAGGSGQSAGLAPWRQLQRLVTPTFLPEAILTAGASQLGMMLLAVAGGLDVSAAIRGGMLLLFPVNMFIQALSQVVVPKIAPRASTPSGLRRITFDSMALAVSVSAYGLVVFIATPVSDFLLGETAEIARSVFYGPLIALVGSVFFILPWGAARATMLQRSGLVARAIIAPITAFAPAILVWALDSPQGAAIGYTAMGIAMVIAALVILRKLKHRIE